MQDLTQPTILLKPFAESGDKNSIPVTNTDEENPQLADLTNGFPAVTSEDPDDGGLPPERKDFNGLGYLTTTYDYFYQAGGTFTFNDTVSTAIGGYPQGARLWYDDGNGHTAILKSTKNDNTDNFVTTPSYIGTSWVAETPVLSWNNTWSGNNTFTGNITSSGNNTFNGGNTFNQATTFAGNISSSGNNTFSGTNAYSNQIVSTVGNAIRFVTGGFGKIFRQSASSFYILLTDENDEYGSYNSLRPFSINCSNGIVTTTPNATTHGIVTTEAISKGGNGYVKLGNGIIIQWGKFTTEDPSITFPTAFSNTNYSITVTEDRDTTNANACVWHTKTSTGVKLYTQGSAGNWIAIGY